MLTWISSFNFKQAFSFRESQWPAVYLVYYISYTDFFIEYSCYFCYYNLCQDLCDYYRTNLPQR